jgi:hypothetical protein
LNDATTVASAGAQPSAAAALARLPQLLGIEGAAPNAIELTGLAFAPRPPAAGGGIAVRIARLAARNLRLRSGPAEAEIGELVLTGVDLTLADAPPVLHAVAIERAQVRGLRLDSGAPVAAPARPQRPATAAAPDPWQLDALAGLYGRVRAHVTDAAWVVDADVTVPIQRGRIDFDAVDVAHVGPDSRMGVSHLGVYVDAPGGRQYLYTFALPQVPGVTFERRGLGFGPFVADRGAIELPPFVASLLRGAAAGMAPAGQVPHDIEATFARTRLEAELRLGDGALGTAQRQLVLQGQGEGANVLVLHSAAMSESLAWRLERLCAREGRFAFQGRAGRVGAVEGTLNGVLHGLVVPGEPAALPRLEATAGTLTLNALAWPAAS